MAISYKGGNRITGLSTDTRPDVINLVDGTIFTETDTGKEYIKYYGQWSERNQPTDSIGLALNYADETNQHFWDFFSGKQIDSRWTITNFNSVTGAIAMDNNIDGGAKLTTSGNRSALQFNNIRQYDHAGSEVIWVTKQVGSGANGALGMAKNSNGFFNGGVHVDFPTSGNITFYTLNDAGSGGSGSTGVAVSESFNWHVYKMTCATSSQTCSIDGVLKLTRTATMDSAMQPVATAYNSSTTLHLRYCEAYNT
jgi:hypothetical protein